MGGVRPEWPLVKPQSFPAQTFASRRIGEVLQSMFCCEVLQLHQYVPHFTLVTDRLFKPVKLRSA